MMRSTKSQKTSVLHYSIEYRYNINCNKAIFTSITNTLKKLNRGGKKNPNLLTNYPTKSTYLINGQMDASPIRSN